MLNLGSEMVEPLPSPAFITVQSFKLIAMVGCCA
jgi:hypothetical protein